LIRIYRDFRACSHHEKCEIFPLLDRAFGLASLTASEHAIDDSCTLYGARRVVIESRHYAAHCTRLRDSPRKDHRGVDLISNALPFGRFGYAAEERVEAVGIFHA